MPLQADGAVRRLRDDAQRERVAVGVGRRERRSRTGVPAAVACRVRSARPARGSGWRRRCPARCGRCSSRSGSRARRCLVPNSVSSVRSRLRARQHGAAVVGAVAGAAAARAVPLRRVVAWSVDPRLADRVHAVRAAVDGRPGVRGVAGACTRRASPTWPWMLRCSARLSLRCELGNSACVEPWQASHARPPWPVGEAVEREARRPARRRWWRRSGRRRRAGAPWRVEDRRVADLRRCCAIAVPVWQLWQVGSSSQPVRSGAPTVAHRAVAALALHRQRAVGGDGRAHRAAQAARHRAGVAAVAGRAVARRRRASAPFVGSMTLAWSRASTRVSGGMPAMPAAGQRLRAVAARAEDRLPVACDRRVEAGGVVAGGGERAAGRSDRPSCSLVVQAQDVQPDSRAAGSGSLTQPAARLRRGAPSPRRGRPRSPSRRRPAGRCRSSRAACPRRRARRGASADRSSSRRRRRTGVIGMPSAMNQPARRRTSSAAARSPRRACRCPASPTSGGQGDAEERGDVLPEVRLADRACVLIDPSGSATAS